MYDSTEAQLGSPVVPFYPFSFWVSLLKPNSRKKGTLIIEGLLGNLVRVRGSSKASEGAHRASVTLEGGEFSGSGFRV